MKIADPVAAELLADALRTLDGIRRRAENDQGGRVMLREIEELTDQLHFLEQRLGSVTPQLLFG